MTETEPASAATDGPAPTEDRAGGEAQPLSPNDWKYDPEIWAWATLSAMREKATESGVAPESVALTPKDIRTAMADQLGLTASQRDFVGDVNGEREYATRCTTMRLLLAQCRFIARRQDGSWVLTHSGVGATKSQFGSLIKICVDSFGLDGGHVHRRYRGHPKFPDGVAAPSEPAPARPPDGRWAYDRRVWGAATLIAIRRVIEAEGVAFAPNISVAYEMERILQLSPRGKQVLSRLNPFEADYKARCNTMRQHLLVAGFVEKRVGEPGWRLTEEGKSATADEVLDGLGLVARHTRGTLPLWRPNQPEVGQAVSPDTTTFFYPGNSALTEGGSANLPALRIRVNSTAHPVAVADLEMTTLSAPTDPRVSPAADTARAVDTPATERADDAEMSMADEGDADVAVEQRPHAGHAPTDVDTESSGTKGAEGALEGEDSDDGVAARWVSYATSQELACDAVPYVACVTMSVMCEAVEHGYPPTAQMINDRLLAHLREVQAPDHGDETLAWSHGSGLWWRFHLARMALWRGAKAIRPAEDDAIGLRDTGAVFTIGDGAANWEPEDVLDQVQEFLAAREPLEWQYDYRAWMWEVLLVLRAHPIDEVTQRQTGTSADITRALVEALPALAESEEDGKPVMAERLRRPEHDARNRTALLYLEYLGVCERGLAGRHVTWSVTEEGDEIGRDELYSQLEMFADVTREDLETLEFDKVRSEMALTYVGNKTLGDVEALRTSKRRSNAELCEAVVHQLVLATEAGEPEVAQELLWERVGAELELDSPLRNPKGQRGRTASAPDLPPWRPVDKNVRTLFAYRMQHVMRALSIEPSNLVKKKKDDEGAFWSLAVDQKGLTSESDEGTIDFGKDVAAYFDRHDYSAWRTAPWMREFCKQLQTLAGRDGTLFEVLVARLLEELGDNQEIEAYVAPKNSVLDEHAVDIVVKRRQPRTEIGALGEVPIYDYGGAEEIWLVQCKHQQGELRTDQAMKIRRTAEEYKRAAGENYRVTTAILAVLGDLDEGASRSVSLALGPQSHGDEADADLLRGEGGSGEDDELRFVVWDGGQILRLVERLKVGVREVGDEGGESSGDLEVDVEYLEQLAREAGIRVSTNETDAGDSSNAAEL